MFDRVGVRAVGFKTAAVGFPGTEENPMAAAASFNAPNPQTLNPEP